MGGRSSPLSSIKGKMRFSALFAAPTSCLTQSEAAALRLHTRIIKSHFLMAASMLDASIAPGATESSATKNFDLWAAQFLVITPSPEKYA